MPAAAMASWGPKSAEHLVGNVGGWHDPLVPASGRDEELVTNTGRIAARHRNKWEEKT